MKVIEKECGNCYYWMKSSKCRREMSGEKPSMCSSPCPDYAEDLWFTTGKHRIRKPIRNRFDILDI
jgi:hypothetical protein